MYTETGSFDAKFDSLVVVWTSFATYVDINCFYDGNNKSLQY